MKTISELNKNWWYRGLKVIYSVFVLFCIGFAVSSIVLSVYLIRENSESYSKELSSYQDGLKEHPERIAFIQELRDKGYTSSQIAQAVSDKYYSFNKYSTIKKLGRADFIAIFGKEYADSVGVTMNTPNKEPEPVFPSTMKWLILFVPLAILMCWFATEIPKRVFYYIFLGSIKPLKNGSTQ